MYLVKTNPFLCHPSYSAPHILFLLCIDQSKRGGLIVNFLINRLLLPSGLISINPWFFIFLVSS